MKLVLLFVSIFFSANVLSAQNENSVMVIKDPRIDVLLKKQAEANDISTRNTSKRKTAKGYRLLLISTNKRNEALAARSKILTSYPDLKPYMWYQAPYYKVKAGNFTSRNDAQAYQKKLSSLFRGNVFIMNDIVEVKAEDNESSE